MTRPETAGQGTEQPPSFNQELLCMFDGGDTSGPFGPRYHIVVGRRLTGHLDVEALRTALFDVVERHQPLRTKIIRGDRPHQQIFPASQPQLEIRACPGLGPAERDEQAQALLVELEGGLIDAGRLPLLRAVLVRFDDRDAILGLMTHHTATDGHSISVLTRDLFAFYKARLTGTVPELPPMRSYGEFVSWERERAMTEEAVQARAWWADAMDGARFTALPADHRKSAKLPAITAGYRFDLEFELLDKVKRLARSAHCSPFMVLLTAYFQLVHQITGEADIVVSTHTLGRAPGLFENTIGSFFNLLPIRVEVDAGGDALALISRVRTACIGAYEYEIPAVQVFAQAPDLMAPAMEDHLTPVTFQALPSQPRQGEVTVGDLSYAVVPQIATALPVSSDIPDGAVWSIILDPADGMSGVISYRTDRFNTQTIEQMAESYCATLAALVAQADVSAGTRPAAGA